MRPLATPSLSVRPATEADIFAMVAISETKRIENEGFSPVFWRKAPDSSSLQERYFQTLLAHSDIVAKTAYCEERLCGFAIGVIATPPPVYAPGGLVCIVDDFAVASPEAWETVGAALLLAIETEAKERGAVLLVVVCPQKETPKRAFLQANGCEIASEWRVKPLPPHKPSLQG